MENCEKDAKHDLSEWLETGCCTIVFIGFEVIKTLAMFLSVAFIIIFNKEIQNRSYHFFTQMPKYLYSLIKGRYVHYTADITSKSIDRHLQCLPFGNQCFFMTHT